MRLDKHFCAKTRVILRVRHQLVAWKQIRDIVVAYDVKKLYADDTVINDYEIQSFIFPYIQVPSPRPVTRRDGHCPSWLFYYQNLTPQGEFLYVPHSKSALWLALRHFIDSIFPQPLRNLQDKLLILLRKPRYAVHDLLCECRIFAAIVGKLLMIKI